MLKKIFIIIFVARRRQESNPLKLGRRKKKKKGIDAAVKLPNGRFFDSVRERIILFFSDT